MSGHSLLAPSAAHRWIPCPGSVALCADIPDRTSPEAAEGTAAHQLAEWTLRTGVDSASKYPDLQIVVQSSDGVESWTFDVDDDMIRHVDSYCDEVRRVATGGELFVEQRVDLSDVLGVDEQGGTADAVVLSGDGTELTVPDLKYGRGVKVYAEGNAQGRLYALGALEKFDLAGTVERVRIVIHQPRLDHLDEEELTVEELWEWGSEANAAAVRATSGVEPRAHAGHNPLVPGISQCRFCPAKARCPALEAEVKAAAFEAFDDLTGEATVAAPPDDGERLGELRSLVPLVEQWCKAIAKEAEDRLHQGLPVAGWKLVEGRRGNRQWDDPEVVEGVMKKTMRLKNDVMYDRKLISPAQARKLVSDKRWEKLEEHVTQSQGKPQAAPETDKRPALDPKAEFDDVSSEAPESSESLTD